MINQKGGVKYLIVTADDFGMTKRINEGIVKAYREGIVTFLNFIPGGEAFDDAVRLARELNLKEVGAHLALTETIPVTAPENIQSLIAKDDWFYRDHNIFFLRFIFGLIKYEQIYVELKNQLQRLKDIGIPITNLSSHEHIHMMPELLKIFIRLAKEYNIPSIRYIRDDRPAGKFDIAELKKRFILSCFTKGMGKVLNEEAISHADHFRGFLDSGKLKEGALIETIKSLEEGTTELASHPGFLSPEVLNRYRFHVNCEHELYALTSPAVKRLVQERGIKLTSYREFLSTK